MMSVWWFMSDRVIQMFVSSNWYTLNSSSIKCDKTSFLGNFEDIIYAFIMIINVRRSLFNDTFY